MEFDEYEYLEKAVEETNGSSLEKDAPLYKENDTPPNKEKELEKSDKGHRRRDRREEDDEFGEEAKENRRSSSKKSRSEENGRERERDRDGDRDRDRERRSRHKSRELDLEKERRSSRDRDMDRERRNRDRLRENDRERRDRFREKDVEIERPRRSRSQSRLGAERERDFFREREDGRRHKDKKEVKEPEVDPERDQRTVFAYQMPLKADERDVYEFFSQVGKVRDVKLITDRMSRRSKGVGYIEFVDAMSVPMAIALSGHLFLGQPIMVKPSEAEKNLVQPTTTGGFGVVGPHGAIDRKLYVGNLHFNMTEPQLRQIFEAFGPVELVQLPTDPETGQCKGFGFIQFAQLEHAKASLSLNGTLEIAGRTIKVSSVTDHIGSQDSGIKAADLDDDDGGGLALNANSRALLMQKLDRSGIASSVLPAVPAVMGPTFSHQGMIMPINPAATLPVVSMAPEPIGTPSECLLLKNMFDPATEEDPEFDLDIRDDVREECSKYGRVVHIYVDKNSSGYVYLRFESVEAAARTQQAMHHRWFARRLISAIFLLPYEYDAKFRGAA